MKRYFFIWALLGALAGLNSCNEDAEPEALAPTHKTTQISAEIVGYEDPANARTLISPEGKVDWDEGDPLTVGYFNENIKITSGRCKICHAIYQDGKFVTEKESIETVPGVKNYLMAMNLLIRVKNGYDVLFLLENNTFKGMESDRSIDMVSSLQDEKLPDKGLGRKDFLSGCLTVTPETEMGTVHFEMKHLLSLLKFKIVNDTTLPFVVKGFKIQTPEGKIIGGEVKPTYVLNGQGEMTLDINQTYARDGLNHSNVYNVTVLNAPETDPGADFEVSALLIPFKLAMGEQISIEVETSAGKFSQVYKIGKDLEFKAGALSTATVKVNQLVAYDDNNVYIPDPALRSTLLEICKKEPDGKLSVKDLEGITKVNISDNNLNTLTGLELLPNLTDLTVESSDIREMDLTRCTKLVNLRTNLCTALRKINVSGMTSLESIEIDNFDDDKDVPMDELNLTGCTNLKKLSIMRLSLPELQLKGLDQLTDISIKDTNVNELDFRECTSLKNCTIHGIPDGLTSINLSGLKQLEKVELYYLDNLKDIKLDGCTQLTRFDFSQGPCLQKMDFSSNTKLQTVIVSQCDLNEINLSNLTELTELDLCENPNLRSVDASGLVKLTWLSIDGCGLTSLNVNGCKQLSTVFAFNNSFTEVDFSECSAYLGRDYNHRLYLDPNPNLKKIYVPADYIKTYETQIPKGVEIIKK